LAKLEQIALAGHEAEEIKPTIDFLRFYSTEPTEVLAKKLGRTEESCTRISIWIKYLLSQAETRAELQKIHWNIADKFIVRTGNSAFDKVVVTTGSGIYCDGLTRLTESFILEPISSRIAIGAAWGEIVNSNSGPQMALNIPLTENWSSDFSNSKIEMINALILGVTQYSQVRFPGKPLIIRLAPEKLFYEFGDTPVLGARPAQLVESY